MPNKAIQGGRRENGRFLAVLLKKKDILLPTFRVNILRRLSARPLGVFF
jgi:hypothetical protein